MTTSTTAPSTTRRRFTQYLVAGAAAVAAPGVPIALASATFEPFEIDSPEGVRVHFSAGKRFHITALDNEGNVLEQYRFVEAREIFSLYPEHFSVRPRRGDTA